MEQIPPFGGVGHLAVNPTHQYMPNKPHKWGTKLFNLCDTSGFSYAFEIYSGAGDNVIPENTPDLGAASNVVVRLSKWIPDHQNHIIYNLLWQLLHIARIGCLPS